MSWEHQPEAEVVVGVIRRVPVAVRRSHVPRVVVPAATPDNPVRASEDLPNPPQNLTTKSLCIGKLCKCN